MVNKIELIELRGGGMTYEAIGRVYGISRQRVHQLITGYRPKNWRLNRNNSKRRYRQTAWGKAILRASQARFRRRVKQCVLRHYGNNRLACVRCGYDDVRALSIDHIESLGTKHKKENGIRSGDGIYTWLLRHNYPEGYQTLCMNCQFIKRYTNNECNRI